MTQGQFKQRLTGLNSEFSFSLASGFTNAEEASLLYYLPIAGGRIIGFIPFPRVLVLYEMQLASSRIWTRIAVSISYNDNHYNTSTSIRIIWLEFELTCYNITVHDVKLWSRVIREQYSYYLTRSWKRKGVYTFPEGISPKVIVIVWLEFELT